MECKTCKYSDLECQEQCKYEMAKEEKRLADKIEQCRGCFGTSFNDCPDCKWHGVDGSDAE